MAKTILGSVTSWGSSPSIENHLITAGISPYAVKISQTTGTSDVTAFSSSGTVFSSMAPGIRSWSGSMSGRYKRGAARHGTGSALLTFTGSASNALPVATVFGYSLSMAAPAFDSTTMSTTELKDSEFTPGLWTWSITMQAFLDDAVALPNTDAGSVWLGTNSAIVLKVSEDGATDNTIGGACIITGYEYGNAIGGLGTANVTVQGTAGLTVVGANNILPAATLIAPTAGALVVRHSTGTNYLNAEGSAFLTGLTLSVPSPGALIDVSSTFQGTGALTQTLFVP